MGSSPISATTGPLVKRLRHRPFTAVTGVRFSHGSPKKEHTPNGVCSFFVVPKGIERAKGASSQTFCVFAKQNDDFSRQAKLCFSLLATKYILPRGFQCVCSFLSSRVHSTCKRLPFLRSKMTTLAVKGNFAFRFSETEVRILRVKPSRACSSSLRAKIFAAGEILPLYSLSYTNFCKRLPFFAKQNDDFSRQGKLCVSL